jgi:hypothetical protein
VFYLGGADEFYPTPTVWHLIYTGDVSEIVSMTITFTNGEVLNWYPSQGFSTNEGGNNPGWVIAAPFNWVIDYVNQGNNNERGSFIVTTDSGNPQFNITGHNIGKDPKEFMVPEYAWGGLVALFACFVALGLFYVKNVGSKNQKN